MREQYIIDEGRSQCVARQVAEFLENTAEERRYCNLISGDISPTACDRFQHRKNRKPKTGIQKLFSSRCVACPWFDPNGE
jgi:hypothetical protein